MDVDAVVLDVDGVLVDVSDSYRRAIVESVETVHDRTIDRESVQAFKEAGGFNDDWELTAAVALYVLALGEGYRGSVETFTAEIKQRGGGFDAAEATVTDELGAMATQRVRDSLDRERLRDVFQALYLGADLYRGLEGGEPPLETDGYVHHEPIIIEPETIEALTSNYHVGVLTGRPAAEAEIALERAGLEVPADHRITKDDPVPGKPDPDGLRELADRLDATALAFVGDTLDDVRTAINAAESDTDREYHGLGVLSAGQTGEAGSQAFNEVGAAAVLEDVNELPAFLSTDS